MGTFFHRIWVYFIKPLLAFAIFISGLVALVRFPSNLETVSPVLEAIYTDPARVAVISLCLLLVANLYWLELIQLKNKYIGAVSESSTLIPDATMSEAIDHVISILFPNKAPNVGNIDIENTKAAQLITEKLRNGELKSWGKYIGESTEREIEKVDWKFRELIPLNASIPTGKNPQTRTVRSDINQDQFTALRVNLDQVKQLWHIVVVGDPEYISMEQVARAAADKHRSLDEQYALSFVSFTEGFHDGLDDDTLNTIARAIASRVDIFGIHHSGKVRIRIDPRELRFTSGDKFGDNGRIIYRESGGFMRRPPVPIWSEICIRKTDEEKALHEIQNYQE